MAIDGTVRQRKAVDLCANDDDKWKLLPLSRMDLGHKNQMIGTKANHSSLLRNGYLRQRLHRLSSLRTLVIFVVAIVFTLTLAANQTMVKKTIKNSVNFFWLFWDNHGFMPHNGPFDIDFGDKYPELAALSKHTDLIRDELQELLDNHYNDITYAADLSPQLKSDLFAKIQWKTFILKHGGFIPENTALAPQTAALIEKVPGIYTAFFSMIGPHDYIDPHWGYYKGFLRYQLALKVPEPGPDGKKCWIRLHPKIARNSTRSRQDFLQEVKDDKEYYEYNWKYGEAILFDDTYLHDALNPTEGQRIVLYMDVARTMPWWLQAINKVSLFMAYRTSDMAEVRKRAVFSAARNKLTALTAPKVVY